MFLLYMNPILIAAAVVPAVFLLIRDQLRTTDTGNDGLIYATPEVLYRDMKSIILFEQDRNAFPLFCRTKTWEPLTSDRS